VTWLQVLALAFALSADAFSVGAALGLRYRTARQTFRLAFHFGLFQALMPLLGALLGGALMRFAESFDHWIAFALLACLGARMIWAGLKGRADEADAVDRTRGWQLVFFSVAVSIDALAAGLALPAARVPVLWAVTVFGVVTAIATFVAIRLAGPIAGRIGHRAEVIAGVVLIAIGAKILLDHLGLLR
jgi:putative Mn2+ efflux pump MntP